MYIYIYFCIYEGVRVLEEAPSASRMPTASRSPPSTPYPVEISFVLFRAEG